MPLKALALKASYAAHPASSPASKPHRPTGRLDARRRRRLVAHSSPQAIPQGFAVATAQRLSAAHFSETGKGFISGTRGCEKSQRPF